MGTRIVPTPTSPRKRGCSVALAVGVVLALIFASLTGCQPAYDNRASEVTE